MKQQITKEIKLILECYPENEKLLKEHIKSWICNFDGWEKGEEHLKYKINELEISDLYLKINRRI